MISRRMSRSRTFEPHGRGKKQNHSHHMHTRLNARYEEIQRYEVAKEVEVLKKGSPLFLQKYHSMYCLACQYREFISVETTVSFGKFVELIRNSVLEILSERSGLQLKRTRRQGKVYYRLRAPIRLLEQHAVNIGYRLQLKPEVDPGYAFWTEEEVHEETTEVRRLLGGSW